MQFFSEDKEKEKEILEYLKTISNDDKYDLIRSICNNNQMSVMINMELQFDVILKKSWSMYSFSNNNDNKKGVISPKFFSPVLTDNEFKGEKIYRTIFIVTPVFVYKIKLFFNRLFNRLKRFYKETK